MDQLRPDGSTITLIHFTHEVDGVPTGKEDLPGKEWRIACMPGMVEFHQTNYHPNYHRSNDVRAVTCPACKKSGTFISTKKSLETALGKIDQ